MGGENKHDELEEQCNAESNSAFLSNWTEDVASASELKPSYSISALSSLAGSTSATRSESDQELPNCDYGCGDTGHSQPSFSSGSEMTPTHLSTSSLDGDGPEDTAFGVAGPMPNALAAGSADSLKLKGLNSVKSDVVRNPSSNTLNKFGSDHQSAGIIQRGFILRKFSSLSNEEPDKCPRARRDNTTLRNRPSNWTWDGYDRYQVNRDGNAAGLKQPNHGSRDGYNRYQFNRDGNAAGLKQPNHGSRDGYDRFQSYRDGNAAGLKEPIRGPRDGYDRFQFSRDSNAAVLKEPNRGPRAQRDITTLSSSFEKGKLGLIVNRCRYNQYDFQTIYDDAKFFVIKSYSEDDVHKSIKYNVWSSTPNGNRKLDTAFHDAGTRSNGVATACPLFLFFSVNGSGQFLGVAEMIGQVDFKKDMDFWKGDKWNGFFPVKWHIIKDIPNSNLRHIILENNDNRPVTYTRDTQEIEFKQGSKMLAIFKNYPAKTSILDDFNYYEQKEKKIQEKSNNVASSQMDTYRTEFLQPEHSGAGLKSVEDVSIWSKRSFNPKTSLATLTKNLSLSSHRSRTN